MRIILDASALIPMLVREATTEAAFATVATATTIMCLRLTVSEVANALAMKAKRGLISDEGAKQALAQSRQYFAQLLDDEIFIEEALDLAITLSHPIYDCLYAIAARREGATLVTADRAFAAKLGANWDVVAL